MSFLLARPKRVLMVISVLARGGCERQLLATVTGLVARGYTVEIFTLAPVPAGEPGFEAEFAALGVKWSCAADVADTIGPSDAASDRHGLRQFAPIVEHLDLVRLGVALERVIAAFRPAIVHCWSELASIVGGCVATALGVSRIILQIVSVSPLRQGQQESHLYRAAYRLLLEDPRVLMLNISSTNARDFERWLDVKPGTVKLLRNGLLPGTVRARRGAAIAACRRQLGLPPGVLTVGALMRFADAKDPDLWLETAAIVAARCPDVHFVLAGYGAMAEAVARKVHELGLADRFVLPGPPEDIGAIYAAMDVFLMTSRFEGTPNALMEAQAAGVPVVTPNVGGTSEIVLDGRSGYVVPERSADALAEAVLRVLHDPLWRSRAAQHGPSFVSRHFGWQRKIDETIAFYGNAPFRLRHHIRRLADRIAATFAGAKPRRGAEPTG